MSETIEGVVTTMGEPFTRLTIASLTPWVGRIVAVVDETKAPPGFAESLGVEYRMFHFEDDFAALANFAMEQVAGADWGIQLDADELIEHGDRLERILAYNAEADVIALPRRHWHDLGRTRECQREHWYPDWQFRIRRPMVWMEGRVHPFVGGTPRVVRSTLATIEHFNLALRTEEEWERVDAYYASLGGQRHPT